jgi:Ca-activated chloride channel family protein
MSEGYAITFLWPRLLWLLLALPLAATFYVALLARRRRNAALHAGLVPVVAGSGWQRALPPLLWLAGLAALLLAVARPQATLTLPSRVDTVILAVDMSGSMKATDVAPNRMTAARDAARAFVDEQPEHVRIGVVGIAAAAAVLQSPTNRREDILAAIERLDPQRGTALGSGIVIALDTALPGARIDVDGFINPRRDRPAPVDAKKEEGKASAPGENTSAAIVLLTDGQSNVGPDPLKAADLAAKHGVRVYTVGLGTPEGAIVKVDGWSMRTRLDEEKLQAVASTTMGEYFRAPSAAELKKVYRALGSKLAFEKQRPTEVTAVFAALGALLATAAALLSLAWFNRIL